jgi:hypothetical protein
MTEARAASIAAAAAKQGFVPFLDAVAWLAKRRPMPLSAAIELANAVRAGRIAAIYRDSTGRWAEAKGAALDRVGLETGEIDLPHGPGAAEPIVAVELGKGWDEMFVNLDLDGEPPSERAEPRPAVELEPEPWEALRQLLAGDAPENLVGLSRPQRRRPG